MSLFTLTGAVATIDSLFGSGSATMHMAYVRCSGNRLTLLQCYYESPETYSSYCGSSDTAGVICTALTGE